jgi:hypothetical protein
MAITYNAGNEDETQPLAARSCCDARGAPAGRG